MRSEDVLLCRYSIFKCEVSRLLTPTGHYFTQQYAATTSREVALTSLARSCYISCRILLFVRGAANISLLQTRRHCCRLGFGLLTAHKYFAARMGVLCCETKMAT